MALVRQPGELPRPQALRRRRRSTGPPAMAPWSPVVGPCESPPRPQRGLVRGRRRVAAARSSRLLWRPAVIVTFYSFKGGVGRSMALVNVAETLAERGYRVILCDWDLEAPGL